MIRGTADPRPRIRHRDALRAFVDWIRRPRAGRRQRPRIDRLSPWMLKDIGFPRSGRLRGRSND